MKRRAVTLSLLVALLATLAISATASAQSSPAQTVYNPNGDVLNVVSRSPADDDDAPPTDVANSGTDTGTAPPVQREAGATQTTATGSLPFTGFEAGIVGAAGLALLGAGFAMRRVSRHQA